jgi:hypothetical protein
MMPGTKSTQSPKSSAQPRADGRIEIVIEFTDEIEWRVLNRGLMKFGRVCEFRDDGLYEYPDLGYGFGLLVPGNLQATEVARYKITHHYFTALINEDKFHAFRDEVTLWNGVTRVFKCDANISATA